MQSIENHNALRSIIDNVSEKARDFKGTSLRTFDRVDESCLVSFAKLLSNRRIAAAYFLLTDLGHRDVHQIVANAQEDTTNDSILDYFGNILYIHFSSALNRRDKHEGISPKEKNCRRIYSGLSKSEKEFVKHLHAHILTAYPEYQDHQSNFLKKIFSESVASQ